jgi:phosphoenolpyruvate carboxylase
VLEQEVLLEQEPALREALEMRAPYVDALSVLQLRALREMRSAETTEDQSAWRRVMLVAVNGVAAGLQNTG